MCEIAIFDPQHTELETIGNTAIDLYQRQRTALGMVAVYDKNGGFEYNTYRSVDPDKKDIGMFLTANEGAKRIIVHGRMATSGEKTNDGTHPLPVDCPKCNGIDHILHNGVLRGWIQRKSNLKDMGHEFSTGVDTEVMAHEIGKIPESIEEAEELIEGNALFRGQAAVIMLGPERIFIAVNIDSRYGSYELNQRCELYKTHREFGNHERTETTYDMVVAEPTSQANEPNYDDAELPEGVLA